MGLELLFTYPLQPHKTESDLVKILWELRKTKSDSVSF